MTDSIWKRKNFIFKSICIILFVLCTFNGAVKAQRVCNEIDFESTPAGDSFDGLLIDSQYLTSFGVLFILEDSTSPRIAQVGAPATAFGSNWGDDTPAPNQEIKTFFLTDDGELSSLTSSPLIFSFASAIDSASGVILDIDFDEEVKIQARNQSDSVLLEKIILSGDQDTGDGRATPWGFRRDQADVHSIKIIGTRSVGGGFGLGFDNLVFCQPEGTTSTTSTSSEEVNIFPNPSPGYLKIRSSSNPISLIEILDPTGRKLPCNIDYGNTEAEIRTDYIGIAWLRIYSQSGVLTKKIVFSQ